MKLSEIKNKKDFIKYMKPYGEHVRHILGEYYEIRKVNMNYDLYEIIKYDESYHKINSKRSYAGVCKPIEKMKVGANECIKLIIKETRKEKLQKINEQIIF